jgi:hypothetical protein
MNGAFGTLDEADEVSCSQRFCIETVSRVSAWLQIRPGWVFDDLGYPALLEQVPSEQSRRSPTHRVISRSLADWLFSGGEMDRWFMHCLYGAYVDVSHLRRIED